MSNKHKPQLDQKLIQYVTDQLYHELAHMFEWEGLPQTVPVDYLERNLTRHGHIMFYYDEAIGHDVLKAEPFGYNRHDLPTHARTFTPTTNMEVRPQIYRNIKYLSDSENVAENFDINQDAVLIRNMPYGQPVGEIVDFFAQRLAHAWQSFDSNLLWANIPYIFQTDNQDTKLSIEKMFAEIYEDSPHVVVDKNLFATNEDRTGVPTGIEFKGKELLDVQNELMMKFRERVGFQTAGVDKAERVNTEEVQSNDQHTKTVLEIMYRQRKQASEAINKFFNQSTSVHIVGQEEEQELQPSGGDEENGTGDGGTEEFTENE